MAWCHDMLLQKVGSNLCGFSDRVRRQNLADYTMMRIRMRQIDVQALAAHSFQLLDGAIEVDYCVLVAPEGDYGHTDSLVCSGILARPI